MSLDATTQNIDIVNADDAVVVFISALKQS